MILFQFLVALVTECVVVFVACKINYAIIYTFFMKQKELFVSPPFKHSALIHTSKESFQELLLFVKT